MWKNSLFYLSFLFAFCEVSAEGRAHMLNEYKIESRNKFVGKEVVTIRTFCIDGYKFISVGSSFLQFYEDIDGLPMPKKCSR